MSRYLLDTDVLIDFSKGIPSVTARILSWVGGDDVVAVCAISIAEFSAGLTHQQLTSARQFIGSLAYWDIGREAAIEAGQNRYRFARFGISITTTDALLAATAREHQATLVTSNVKDFPTDDVTLLSIRRQ